MNTNDHSTSLSFLHTVIKNSLIQLLHEADKRDVVKPPYGRPATPSPFVNECDIDPHTLLDEPDEEDNDRAHFIYEYGFNPLLYLADVIHRSHPASIAAREKQRHDAVQRLTHRVNHARKQLQTSIDIQRKAKFMLSGITQGPLTTAISPTAVLLWCRTCVPGDITIQLSKARSFSTIRKTITVHSDGANVPLSIQIDDLDPDSHYFIRCSMPHLKETTDEVEEDVESDTNPTHDSLLDDLSLTQDTDAYAKCECWTLQSIPDDRSGGGTGGAKAEGSRGSYPIEIVTMARYFNHTNEELYKVFNEDNPMDPGYGVVAIPCDHPVYTCLLGDIFTPVNAKQNPDVHVYESQLWDIFGKDVLLSTVSGGAPDYFASTSPLCLGSMFLAWNDSKHGADTDLRAEEVLHKQFIYDTKKYEKKIKERAEKEKRDAAAVASGERSKMPTRRNLGPPPTFNRPPMTPTLSALVKDLPIMYSEEHVRHLYRCIQLTPQVDIFILDCRHGLIGKEQIRWLKDGLRKSEASMKLIFSGRVMGTHLKNVLKMEDGASDVNLNTSTDSMEFCDPTGFEDSEVEEVEAAQEFPESSVAEEEKEELQEKKETSKDEAKKSRTVSSSRQKSLEAAKEEYDENGLPKSSLQHAIVSMFNRTFPEGYKDINDNPPEPTPRIVSEPTELSPTNSPRMDENTGEIMPPSFDFEDEVMEKVEVLGGILILSSTGAADSFVNTYNFSDTPIHPRGDVKRVFCMEVGLGTASLGPEEECREVSSGIATADEVLRKGRDVLFRSSMLPVDTEPLAPADGSDHSGLENDNQGKDEDEGGDIFEDPTDMKSVPPAPTLQTVTQPIAASVCVRRDGSVNVQLREFGSGKVLFQRHVVTSQSP